MNSKRNHTQIWSAALLSGALLLASLPAVAQDSQQQNAPPADSQDRPSSSADQAPAPAPAAGEKCWQQAGLTKEEMQQRRSIMGNAKAEIEQISQNTSLTPQQQRQQIRQVRRSAREQLDKILTAEQKLALQQCQRDKRAEHSTAPRAAADNPRN